MSDEGDDETAGSCRLSPAEAAPLDSEAILGEILLRLPSQPSSLPRVSVVSKLWGSLVSSAAFHRRFRAHHQEPPILGVYGKSSGDIVFTSVLDPPDRIPAERFALPVSADDFFDSWNLLGCRHGRVLAFNRVRLELLVFHPVSGDLRTVALPREFNVAGYGHGFSTNGAVLCAAGDDDPGHVHGGCHSSPFKPEARCDQEASIAGAEIRRANMRIIRAEDGDVGIVISMYPSFHMWDHKVNCHGGAKWVLRKTVGLQNIIGLPPSTNAPIIAIVAYAEDTDEIFLLVRGAGYPTGVP
ncbi:hypothetical protein ACQ4PT_062367 [Festuca glaucescens]